MIALWRWIRENHYGISAVYLCVAVTIIIALLLTASPVETCN